MPENLWVAEVLGLCRDNRVAAVFVPGSPRITAVGKPLRLIVIGETGNEATTGYEVTRIIGINDGASGKNGSHRVRIKRDRQFIPVHQIGADRMAPVHRSRL